MSYAEKHLRVEFDYQSTALIALFIVFQATVLWIIRQTQRAYTVPEQQSGVALSGQLLTLAAVEIAVIIILWRLYKRLSGKWQTYIKYAIIGLFASLGWMLVFSIYWGTPLIFIRDLAGAILVYFAIKFTSSTGLRWIAFNLIALLLGVLVTSIGSQQIAPSVVIPFMVAFTLYDYLAVDLSNIMGDLIELYGSVKIPNIVVIPNRLRVDLDELFAYMREERETKPDGVEGLIGLGDFVFPTLLLGSVFVHEGVTFTPPVVGVLLGTLVSIPVLRAALVRRDKATPALPWLNTGAIGGYVVGLLVVHLSVIA